MTSNKNGDQGVVYSTEQGKMCPDCGQAVNKCGCSQNKSVPESDGVVRVALETKGRKGKGMTVITGIPLAHKELKAFGKQLKKRCGTGGTVKDGTVEIQGDHRNVLVEELKKKKMGR